jgi:hypothetical protein
VAALGSDYRELQDEVNYFKYANHGAWNTKTWKWQNSPEGLTHCPRSAFVIDDKMNQSPEHGVGEFPKPNLITINLWLAVCPV